MVVAAVWLLTDRRYLGQRMPLALVDRLRGSGHPPTVVVAGEGPRLSVVAPLTGAPPESPWARLEPGDLVVTRSRDPFALALAEEAEARGARALDGIHAVERVRNKARCALGLARRGLPVPPTVLADGPGDLTALPSSAFPIVVKPLLGDNAQGVRVVLTREDLAGIPWRDEPHLAQGYVEAGGFDLKLYVAGDRVWATRRPGPLSGRDDPPVRIRVSAALRRIAAGCREEFGLTLFGVDVLEGGGRLAIVDVNEFPNYTGVDDAPEAIGDLVLAAAGLRAEPASPTTTMVV
jgi:ribosomal protein S6--L-glutamate ligase